MNYINILFVILGIFACSIDSDRPITKEKIHDAEAKKSDGFGLYREYCSGCHDDLENSKVKYTTVAKIKEAMKIDNMKFLQSELNSQEIKAIELALNSGGASSGDSSFGGSSFGGSSSGSSGSGDSSSGSSSSGSSGSGGSSSGGSSSEGTSSEGTSSGNDDSNNNSGNNDSNSNIDGAKLYKKYCSACHRLLNDSTKKGATVGRIKSGLNLKSMKFLKSKLREDEIKAIAKVLSD